MKYVVMLDTGEGMVRARRALFTVNSRIEAQDISSSVNKILDRMYNRATLFNSKNVDKVFRRYVKSFFGVSVDELTKGSVLHVKDVTAAKTYVVGNIPTLAEFRA